MNPAADHFRDYWERRLAAGPSLETVGWLGLGRSFNRRMYQVRARQFAHRVSAALRKRGMQPTSAKVLDVGSGSGFYVDAWKRLGVRDLHACDITDAVGKGLAERHPDVAFRRLDIGSAKGVLPKSAFDIISCMDVLFHITDDLHYETAIENLSSALRPGGLLVFTENCLHAARHVGEYQVSRKLVEIAASLGSAELHILERRPAFVLMNTPIDSTSRLLHRAWSMTKRVAGYSETLASVVSTALFPLELLFVSVLREGPSTEFLIAAKRDAK